MKHALIVILALAFASPAAADPPRADGYVYGDWVEFTTPEGIPKAAPPIPRITFSSRQLHVARDKTMSVLMGCRPGTTPCKGTIAVRSSSDSITRRERFTIGAGHWKRIRLALTRKGQRLGRGDDGMQMSIEVRTAGALLSASRRFSAK